MFSCEKKNFVIEDVEIKKKTMENWSENLMKK